MAISWRLKLGDNICRLYRSIFNHCDVFGQQRNRNRRKKRKISAITPFRVIQGNRSRYHWSHWSTELCHVWSYIDNHRWTHNIVLDFLTNCSCSSKRRQEKCDGSRRSRQNLWLLDTTVKFEGGIDQTSDWNFKVRYHIWFVWWVYRLPNELGKYVPI